MALKNMPAPARRTRRIAAPPTSRVSFKGFSHMGRAGAVDLPSSTGSGGINSDRAPTAHRVLASRVFKPDTVTPEQSCNTTRGKPTACRV